LAAGQIETKLVARVGSDDFFKLCARFEKKNVKPVFTADPKRQTGILVSLIAKDGERSFYTDRGANLALREEDIPQNILDGVGLVMLSGYSFFAPSPRAVVRGVMERASKLNIPVAIDPASYGFIKDVGVENFIEWTKGAAILLPNSQEAQLLSLGAETAGEQLQKLGQYYDQVILKQGENGACAIGNNGQIVKVKAPKIVAIDTTGAGDAFAAGFIGATLSGLTLEKCLQAGVAQGSLASTRFGSQPA